MMLNLRFTWYYHYLMAVFCAGIFRQEQQTHGVE